MEYGNCEVGLRTCVALVNRALGYTENTGALITESRSDSEELVSARDVCDIL